MNLADMLDVAMLGIFERSRMTVPHLEGYPVYYDSLMLGLRFMVLALLLASLEFGHKPALE